MGAGRRMEGRETEGGGGDERRLPVPLPSRCVGRAFHMFALPICARRGRVCKTLAWGAGCPRHICILFKLPRTREGVTHFILFCCSFFRTLINKGLSNQQPHVWINIYRPGRPVPSPCHSVCPLRLFQHPNITIAPSDKAKHIFLSAEECLDFGFAITQYGDKVNLNTLRKKKTDGVHSNGWIPNF